MNKIFVRLMIAILMVVALPAVAEEHRGGEFRGGEHRGGERHWEGREIHRFGGRDLEIWRGGRWYHGRHEGRRGWWWVAAGIWYFYPSPVYPYPDPYTPPVAIINQQPPVVVAPQPPVMVAPQAPAPVQAQPQPAQLWYYCESSKTYYPYVASCAEGWKSVPAQAPQGVQQ